jgi:hypothetical protein
MAGIIVPTADEVKQEFRTTIMAVGRGQLLPNLDEFGGFFKHAGLTEDPWSNQEHGVDTIVLETDRVLLVRAFREWFIDDHRDGQLPRIKSQIREVASSIHNAAGNSTIDFHFDLRDEGAPGGKQVKCWVQGIARNFEVQD